MKQPALLALLAPILGWSGQAMGEPLERVAIVVTSSVNASEFELEQLQIQLGTELERQFRVQVISTAEAASALAKFDAAEACQQVASCAAEVGSRLRVAHILLMAVNRIGKRVQIETTWASGDAKETRQLDPMRIEPVNQDQLIRSAAAGMLPARLRRSDEADVGQPTGLWVATGVSAAGLTAATVLSIVAKRHYDSHQDDASARRRQRILNLAADASWALALGGGLLAGYYLFFGGSDTTPEGPTVQLGGSQMSVGWSSRF